MPEHPTRFTLERLLAEDLPAPDAAFARGHLSGCHVCHAIVQELEADMAAFRIEVPFSAFAARNAARTGSVDIEAPSRGSVFSRWRYATAGTLALGMAAMLLLLPNLLPPAENNNDTHIKGIQLADAGASARIGYLVVTAAEPMHRALAGEERQPGDEIVVTLDAPDESGFVAVVGIDGSGKVHTYYPTSGDTLAAMPPDGHLPRSLVLDQSSGAERLFAVFSARPEPLAQILRAAEQLAGTDLRYQHRLALPAHFAQDSTWFSKPQ